MVMNSFYLHTSRTRERSSRC